jgi:hypothetical protein
MRMSLSVSEKVRTSNGPAGTFRPRDFLSAITVP